MIHVEQGDEYRSETYIWCDVESGGRPIRVNDQGMFEGDSIKALMDFLMVHRHG